MLEVLSGKRFTDIAFRLLAIFLVLTFLSLASLSEEQSNYYFIHKGNAAEKYETQAAIKSLDEVSCAVVCNRNNYCNKAAYSHQGFCYIQLWHGDESHEDRILLSGKTIYSKVLIKFILVIVIMEFYTRKAIHYGFIATLYFSSVADLTTQAEFL